MSNQIENPIALAIHGGAGTITQGSINREEEEEYRRGLREPLEEGKKMLQVGVDAFDVVVHVVAMLEDNPLFNAGRGSVFTNSGTHEMDAAVMRGSDRAAGAVAGVSGIRNPIELARLVLEKSEHVLLAGAGAEEFAREMGLPFEEAAYFHTDQRYAQLLEAQKVGRVQLDHTENGGEETGVGEEKFGTVGAVACDVRGNLAAATSTGGMTNKRWGRVGDSPLIGAGTWADNRTCAVSCTGHGEYFMRWVAAYDLAALIEYRGLPLEEMANYLVKIKLREAGGEGGLIAVNRQGEVALPFNSEGMYRGWTDGTDLHVGIYRDLLG
ncbi:MAG: isoaspartyl peptidase/L-asparaginase [Ignavibacteriae bacterium]|nr:isoaspartyl peptidase/L-asparaginase [Ignavibacteriota bacterium]